MTIVSKALLLLLHGKTNAVLSYILDLSLTEAK